MYTKPKICTELLTKKRVIFWHQNSLLCMSMSHFLSEKASSIFSSCERKEHWKMKLLMWVWCVWTRFYNCWNEKSWAVFKTNTDFTNATFQNPRKTITIFSFWKPYLLSPRKNFTSATILIIIQKTNFPWMNECPYKKLAHQYHKLRQKIPPKRPAKINKMLKIFWSGRFTQSDILITDENPRSKSFHDWPSVPCLRTLVHSLHWSNHRLKSLTRAFWRLFLIWGKPRFSQQFLLSAWKHTCLHAAREHACAHKKSKKRTILSHKMKKIDYYPPSFLRCKAQNFSVFSTYQEPNSHTKNEEHYSTATT